MLTFDASVLAERGGGAIGTALHTLFATPTALPLPAQDAAVQQLQTLWQALHAERSSTRQRPRAAVAGVQRTVAHGPVAPALRRPAARQGRHALYALAGAGGSTTPSTGRFPATPTSWGLSAERLNRLVQAETGHSAQHVVHARLVREACRLLVGFTCRHRVSQLAFDLGFSDPAYFSRFFAPPHGPGHRRRTGRRRSGPGGFAGALIS